MTNRNQHTIDAPRIDYGRCTACRSILDYVADEYGRLIPSCFQCEQRKRHAEVARRYPRLAAMEQVLTPEPSRFTLATAASAARSSHTPAEFRVQREVLPLTERRVCCDCGVGIPRVATRCKGCSEERRYELRRKRRIWTDEGRKARREAYHATQAHVCRRCQVTQLTGMQFVCDNCKQRTRHRMQPGGQAA